MSDLIKKNDNLTEKNSTIATRPTVGILQKIAAQKRALLVDVSGSMDSTVTDGRKIDILNGLLQSLTEELKKTRLFKFSDWTEEIETFKPIPVLTTEGGTGMHLAFRTLKEKGVKEIVLLTDGEPDMPSLAITAAQGLKIDIVYIGSAPAPQFLNDLARVSGGKFQDQNMLVEKSSLLLRSKIKGLLTQGK